MKFFLDFFPILLFFAAYQAWDIYVATCMDAAVPPSWESKSDWQIFKLIARKFSEIASKHFPAPFKDVIAAPLLHDTPGEIAQREVKDWKLGECEAIPGKTMPNLAIVERDYANLYNRYISVGPAIGHLGAHGVAWEADDFHEKLLKEAPTVSWNGKQHLSLEEEESVANVIFTFAPETIGELSYRSYQNLEKRVGKPLASIAEGNRNFRITMDEIRKQPIFAHWRIKRMRSSELSYTVCAMSLPSLLCPLPVM